MNIRGKIVELHKDGKARLVLPNPDGTIAQEWEGHLTVRPGGMVVFQPLVTSDERIGMAPDYRPEGQQVTPAHAPQPPEEVLVAERAAAAELAKAEAAEQLAAKPAKAPAAAKA